MNSCYDSDSDSEPEYNVMKYRYHWSEDHVRTLRGRVQDMMRFTNSIMNRPKPKGRSGCIASFFGKPIDRSKLIETICKFAEFERFKGRDSLSHYLAKHNYPSSYSPRHTSENRDACQRLYECLEDIERYIFYHDYVSESDVSPMLVETFKAALEL